MRLTLKLTLALSIVLSIQFTIYGYLVARRLTGFFDRDIKEDAQMIGRALAVAANETWKARGIEEAQALIKAANNNYEEMQIRFVWLTGEHRADQMPELSTTIISEMKKDFSVFNHIYPDQKSETLYTYVRVPNPSPDMTAIELKQSFASENLFTRISVIRVIAFLLIVVFTTTVVMLLLGVLLIGKPIQRLRDKTKRIGLGDLSGQLEIRGKDEIAQLSHEINLMNDQLVNSRRIIEEETNRRIAAIEQLRHGDRLQTIGTLASGVAHELGTPLTVALGHLTQLPNIKNPIEVEHLKNLISEQLQKMAGIVKQLLGFSRRRPLERLPCNLCSILAHVSSMLMPFGEKRNIKVEVKEYPANALVEGDPTQLEQVFINIVLNAIQATDSGTVTVCMTRLETEPPQSQSSEKSQYFRIDVQDMGVGMNQEQIKQIFDPFFTTKPPGSGTGMGLSIAHGIVQEHHGWITVESSPPTGTCFSVFLPVLRES